MKIVFVGLGGCPFSNRAADVRQKAFAELFVKLGYEVEIINRFSRNKCERHYDSFKVVEPFHNVKAKGKITYAFFYLIALLCEPFRLLRSNRARHIDVVYVYSSHTIDHFLYKILCLLMGAKLVGHYCEYVSSMKRPHLYFRLNRRFIDSTVLRWWDGAICISHFLEQVCNERSPRTKTMIVYPICDFSTYAKDNASSVTIDDDYIIFCSSSSYDSLAEFVIKAYHMSTISKHIRMVIVLSGEKSKIDALKTKYPDVLFLTNLDYSTLIAYYRKAQALLIPLRTNLRDKARFPHKICEYAATNGIIVTTNQGEIPYLFEDGQNALVADGYDVRTFAEKLDLLVSDIDFRSIKERCYKTGLDYFDIHAYLKSMDAFMKNVVSSDHVQQHS